MDVKAIAIKDAAVGTRVKTIVATQPATVGVESAVGERSAQNHVSAPSKMQGELDGGVPMTAPQVQPTMHTITNAVNTRAPEAPRCCVLPS